MRLRLVSYLALVFCASCGAGDGRARDAGDSAVGSCGSRVGGPALPLVISASDYTSGSLCAASAGAGCAERNLETFSGDTVLAWHDANTLLGLSSVPTDDSVYVYDVREALPRLVRQLSARAAGEARDGNPRGYFPINERDGYVARFNQNALLRVNVVDGGSRLGPDLAPYRGAGLHPYPKRFASVNGELWLTLLRLDSLTDPTTTGAIAALDPATDSVRDVDPMTPGTQVIELPLPNPLGPLSVRNGRVAVACAGAYTRLDGGVVLVDGATHAVSVAVREEELDGNVDAAIWLDDERLLLKVVGRTNGELAIDSARLVEWSLRTRTAREWLRVREWTLTEPVLGSDGLVYVGDRGDEATARPHGIRVFNAQDGSERTSAPVSCGLQPYDLLPEFSAAR
jgi:hypothetical protein